ncbi:hypothetical protein AJ78_04839 [Emergomyces pasteurianus Ep9510]|uniref:Arginyl-tRNA synthetase catalytic core domain-containing protein n=1 Tax=Emergomyces pasteurianus Ep9510 TaxID=1447872 RepID=A0A1J9QFF2_9EURO|nr:hypothetical protein AJ78_04839 [Emergomyces pasteurianus Ep9510]
MPGILSLWKRFCDISIERYISSHARLNIAFDEYFGELTARLETIEKVEKLLREKRTYKENEGSRIIDFKRHGEPNLGTAVIGKSSSRHRCCFRAGGGRVFKTIELMGCPDIAAKLALVSCGKAQGMLSRPGTVKLLVLSDILDERGNAMHEVMRTNEAKYAQVMGPEEVADIVGITELVMAQDMSGERINNYAFDITKMTSFEGHTGRPYLQTFICEAFLDFAKSPTNYGPGD